jgi:hypothetical protein
LGKLDVTAKVITIVAGTVAIITFLAGYLQSFNTSDTFTLFEPWTWYLITGIALGVAILFAVIYRRYQLNHRGIFAIIPDRDNYRWPLGEQPFKGVVWDVYGANPEPLKNKNVFVTIPPKCPKCKTKLEESERFIGGYKWRCIGCGFSKSNKDSFGKESDRVERLVEGQFERERQGQPAQDYY